MIFNQIFNQKKQHYNEARKNLKKFIWNLEFDVVMLRTMREGFRTEYDRLKEMVNGLEVRTQKLKERNAEGDVKEIDQVNAQVEKFNQDLSQLQEQMQGIDNEIEGFTYQDDKGQLRRHEGILEKIGKHNTKLEMLKDYVKSL